MRAPTDNRPAADAALVSEVARRASFDYIRYSQSWEDPRSLQAALQPNDQSHVLSIAASGDNAFALLLQGAGHVTCVDLSPAQCALVELKRAALRTLTHEQLLRFVGAQSANDRGALYARVRTELPIDARAWWDVRSDLIARGVIHVGKLEQLWRIYRTRVHPWLHGPRTTRAAFEIRTRMERELFWHDRWNNRRWHTAIQWFFSEPVIARLGRDPAFFEHVQINVSRHYSQRAYHAFVELDPATNYFLQYILLGTYLDVDHGPPWLMASNHATLVDRLDRMEVQCTELESFVNDHDAGVFTGVNLSDVFEWMSDELHDRVYRAVVRACAPNATLAYWNNLVPRSAPAHLVEQGSILPDRPLAQSIHDADRAFLYRDFHVDRVIDPQAVTP